jgi:hypothetical protein
MPILDETGLGDRQALERCRRRDRAFDQPTQNSAADGTADIIWDYNAWETEQTAIPLHCTTIVVLARSPTSLRQPDPDSPTGGLSGMVITAGDEVTWVVGINVPDELHIVADILV